MDLTKLRKIKSHTFRGKKYKIEVKKIPDSQEAAALTDAPSTKGKRVVIDPRHYDDQDLLQTLIDECFHTVMFDIENDAVDEMARDIARFLWRAGYRLVGD